MSINSSIVPQRDEKLLQVFENIKKSVAEIENIDDLLQLKNLAGGYEKAWKSYHDTSGYGFQQMFYGWETKVRCERKMGGMLKKTELNKGAATPLHDERGLSLPKLDDLGISEIQSFRYQKLTEIPEKEFDKKILEFWVTFREPTTAELFRTAHVSHNSGEDEWYTPPEIIELARKTMGSIDLDPASSSKANETVKAEKYFTVKDNGLSKEWFGNVWLNPPYSQPLIEEFCKKLINSLKNISQACVLVNNATETQWLQPLLRYCNGVCFLKGRVRFIDKNGEQGQSPLQGQVVVYFGKDRSNFDEYFGTKGVILWTEE